MDLEIIPTNKVIVHDIEYNGIIKPGNEVFLLFDSIICGVPNFTGNIREGMIEIPKKMIGPGEYFALRAKGDSMINAGIGENDVLIIKMQNNADDGQIVVASVGQDYTLKRFFRREKDKKILLHPENDKYDDIITDKCEIMGVAVKIIKNI